MKTTTKAIAGKFPNGTATLMELLSNALLAPLDWAEYCALSEADHPICELRADTLNQSMLYLMNLRGKMPRRIYAWIIPKGTTPCINLILLLLLTH